MHCVDLGESFQTHIYLQSLASIQPRTSPVKFLDNGCVATVHALSAPARGGGRPSAHPLKEILSRRPRLLGQKADTENFTQESHTENYAQKPDTENCDAQFERRGGESWRRGGRRSSSRSSSASLRQEAPCASASSVRSCAHSSSRAWGRALLSSLSSAGPGAVSLFTAV